MLRFRHKGAVTTIQGISNVSIDYTKNTVTVQYDPKKASPEKITTELQEEITGSPVVVTVAEEEKEEKEEPTRDHHAQMVQKGKANELKLKVITSGVIFVLVFLGSFQQWFPWMPDFLKNNFVLLALATPVQFWAG
jgi:cation transport ATPase